MAVLAGLALLFALGVSAGWIGEGARCLIGAAACGALLVAGIVLHERAGRTEAARTAVASALAGLFLTIAVASSIYDVLPDTFGLLAAAAVAASGTALAIRWASPVIAALGLVGAGLAPVLAGLATTPAGLGFLAVATAASVAVLVWQRWAWLSACVAVVATPQWLGWLADGQAWGWTLLVLVGFGTLLAVSAVGSALRAPGAPLRALPGVLLAMNALVLGLAGWAAFKGYDGRAGASAWLAALAVAHLAVGLAGRRSARLPGELAVLCLTLGVVLADVAFATLTGGLVQAAGWTLGVVVFAGVARLTREDRREAAAAASGLGLHVGLAILTALPEVDPGTLLAAGLPSATAAAMAAALAGACLLSARLAPSLAAPLNLTGLLAAAGLAALALDGAALTAAWALEAAALCAYGARGQEGAWEAGLAHLGAALTWWLVDQAPPGALAEAGVPLGPVAVGGLALLVAPATVGRLAAAAIVRPSWVRWPRSGSGWPRA